MHLDAQSQSALDPAADSAAALLGELGTVLYIGAGAIFLFVMTLALFGVYAKATPVNTRRWIIGGGLIFPTITLSVLLVYSLAVGNAISAIGTSSALQLFLDCFGSGRNSEQNFAAPLRIEVVGKQWWWEVRYPQSGRDDIVLANELHIPTGRAVELVLSSTDVIHSVWVPALAGKVDMIPGRTTRLLLQTTQAGIYRGQCAEYCGGQHALMALHVVAEEVQKFEAWLERQAMPASVPSDPFLKLGYDAFFQGECHECHAVRGTPATSTLGPDLTHVGGRYALAAGVLRNHAGTMAGWIAGAQDVKPGNFMPSMAVYTGRELRAVSAWLESLK